jgi:O-methyltransferase involved in polyketide biosynthesis
MISVVVAEGVLMYLPPAAVSELLESIRAVTGPGSSLVFTWSRGDPAGRPDAGRLTGPGLALMKMLGEPVPWSPTEERLASVLAEHGFRLAGDPVRFDLRARCVVPAGLDLPAARPPEQVAVATC